MTNNRQGEQMRRALEFYFVGNARGVARQGRFVRAGPSAVAFRLFLPMRNGKSFEKKGSGNVCQNLLLNFQARSSWFLVRGGGCNTAITNRFTSLFFQNPH